MCNHGASHPTQLGLTREAVISFILTPAVCCAWRPKSAAAAAATTRPIALLILAAGLLHPTCLLCLVCHSRHGFCCQLGDASVPGRCNGVCFGRLALLLLRPLQLQHAPFWYLHAPMWYVSQLQQLLETLTLPHFVELSTDSVVKRSSCIHGCMVREPGSTHLICYDGAASACNGNEGGTKNEWALRA